MHSVVSGLNWMNNLVKVCRRSHNALLFVWISILRTVINSGMDGIRDGIPTRKDTPYVPQDKIGRGDIGRKRGGRLCDHKFPERSQIAWICGHLVLRNTHAE